MHMVVTPNYNCDGKTKKKKQKNKEKKNKFIKCLWKLVV